MQQNKGWQINRVSGFSQVREMMKQLWALSVNVGERMPKGTGNTCALSAAISVHMVQMVMSYHLMSHYLDFGIT